MACCLWILLWSNEKPRMLLLSAINFKYVRKATTAKCVSRSQMSKWKNRLPCDQFNRRNASAFGNLQLSVTYPILDNKTSVRCEACILTCFIQSPMRCPIKGKSSCLCKFPPLDVYTHMIENHQLDETLRNISNDPNEHAYKCTIVFSSLRGND